MIKWGQPYPRMYITGDDMYDVYRDMKMFNDRQFNSRSNEAQIKKAKLDVNISNLYLSHIDGVYDSDARKNFWLNYAAFKTNPETGCYVYRAHYDFKPSEMLSKEFEIFMSSDEHRIDLNEEVCKLNNLFPNLFVAKGHAVDPTKPSVLL